MIFNKNFIDKKSLNCIMFPRDKDVCQSYLNAFGMRFLFKSERTKIWDEEKSIFNT